MNEATKPTVTVPTKYGDLVVTFQGTREYEEHSFSEGRKTVTKSCAWVRTLDGKPLTIHGVEYQVYGSPVYGEHYSGQAEGLVTDWHYQPGEYASASRKWGGLQAFIGEPTSKARAVVRDLILEAVTKAADQGILSDAEAVRLDEAAERAEKESQEAYKLAANLRDKAAIMRAEAQKLRWERSKVSA